jgi:hypothetical protein
MSGLRPSFFVPPVIVWSGVNSLAAPLSRERARRGVPRASSAARLSGDEFAPYRPIQSNPGISISISNKTSMIIAAPQRP